MLEIRQLGALDIGTACVRKNGSVTPMGCQFESNRPTLAIHRGGHLFLGLLFVVLAVLGTALPILPTTPFLILASNSFARSSPRLQTWLMRLPVWGPILKDWETHRAVRPHTKRMAFAMIAVAIMTSAVFGRLHWPVIVILFWLALIGIGTVSRLPVISTTR